LAYGILFFLWSGWSAFAVSPSRLSLSSLLSNARADGGQEQQCSWQKHHRPSKRWEQHAACLLARRLEPQSDIHQWKWNDSWTIISNQRRELSPLSPHTRNRLCDESNATINWNDCAEIQFDKQRSLYSFYAVLTANYRPVCRAVAYFFCLEFVCRQHGEIKINTFIHH